MLMDAIEIYNVRKSNFSANREKLMYEKSNFKKFHCKMEKNQHIAISRFYFIFS